MSQLKHRISIGKVVSGEWKFDHYATSQELELLKVSPDGRVFNMVQSQDYEPPVRPVIDWYKANNTIRVGMVVNQTPCNMFDDYPRNYVASECLWLGARDE